MAELMIRKVGDPVLRSEAKPVTKITGKTRELVANMLETMYNNNGIGLAAPQVGILQKIIVIDTKEGELVKVINPEIITKSKEKDIREEGCLSIPGETGHVLRSKQVTVKGLNENGQEVTYEATGILARAFQHEIDHLQGILFIDKIVDIDGE